MQHILTVVSVPYQEYYCSTSQSSLNCDASLVREVDVVEEEREVLEHPLGEVEVDGRALEEAHMEDGLPNASTVFNLHIHTYNFKLQETT